MSDEKTYGGQLMLVEIKNITILQSGFHQGFSKYYGGSMYIKDCLKIHIESSLIEDGYTYFDKNIPRFSKKPQYLLS